MNTIQILDDKPINWPGQKSQVVISGTGLELQEILPGEYYTYGTYQFSDLVDLSEAYTVRLSSYIKATPLGSGVSADWSVTTEVRTTIGTLEVIADWNTMAEIDPIAPIGRAEWTEWLEFYAGEFTGRYFQFRLIFKTAQPARNIYVDTAEIHIDMPDRIEADEDVICPAGGLTVNFDPAFRVAPSIAISAQGLQSGDYYVITGRTRLGFTIAFYDSADAPIERTFDWMANGYGRVYTANILDTRYPISMKDIGDSEWPR